MARRHSSKPANPVAFFIIAAVMVFMALEMVITGMLQDKKTNALRARCTAETTATVTNVVTESRTRKVHRNKHTYTETYYVYISDMYYEVDGKNFGLKDERSSKDFEKDQQVQIKYDPDSPDVYYLERSGDGKKLKFSLIPGTFIMIMALIMAIAGIRAKMNVPKNNGMTFEQWQEQQKQKEAELKNVRMDEVDQSFMQNTQNAGAPYLGSLNNTGDYMESIGGPEDNGGTEG